MALDLSKLSDAELEAISSGDLTSLSDATLKSLAGTPTGDYRVEALRQGLASTPAMAAGLGALYGESSAGQGSGIPQLIQALRKPSQPATGL